MDGKTRCLWCGNDPLYQKYHDTEWGKAVTNDAIFFEFLLLETFQAGLSWITILRKRENFSTAFDHFDYKKIADYDQIKIQDLMNNTGIIRHRLKILSAISNAKAFMEVQHEFGSFSNYIWKFTNGHQIVNHPKSTKDLVATSELSDQISIDLKKRGFKFVGSTVVYAFLQATGIVDDHVVACFLAQPSR